MPARFPMPYPNSWYAVAHSEDLRPGATRRLKYLGRELVAFRGQDGKASVLDAYCPHLGAHLGVGGKVVDGTLVCPFHGWRFASDGKCVEAPYAKKTPRCSVGAWHTVERNGLVWIWYHALGSPPEFELPTLAEYQHKEWTPYRRFGWTVASHGQEMAENAVDSAHFLYVHGTLGVPEVHTEVLPDCFHALNTSKNRRFGMTVSTTVDVRVFMPGMSAIRFNELAEILLVASTTPIDEEHIEQRFLFTARRKGNPVMRKFVSTMFMREVARQFEQDLPIWENKVHLTKPVLCDGDGPIWQFRKWYQRFYSAHPISGATVGKPSETATG